jgi:hypothetical protein
LIAKDNRAYLGIIGLQDKPYYLLLSSMFLNFNVFCFINIFRVIVNIRGLLKIYRQADKQIFNNRDYLINVLPNIYNNPKYIDETEYIEIKKHA